MESTDRSWTRATNIVFAIALSLGLLVLVGVAVGSIPPGGSPEMGLLVFAGFVGAGPLTLVIASWAFFSELHRRGDVGLRVIVAVVLSFFMMAVTAVTVYILLGGD